MADVFISYASEDRNRVRPLAEALQARGFDVWWDRALGAGQDYTAVIERELRAARAVIVVWTQASAASTFVRDEAGRARDEGRLIPVLLDPVDIPLGFGSFQAEDFTRWNGGSAAAQMQILEEAIKAKLEGRDQDGAAIARKRRRLMGRVRLVSLLAVTASVVGIAAGLNNIFNPQEPAVVQPDLRAELLRLLAEGKLTPEQAIQLAGILEAGALGEASQTQLAENQAPGAAPSPGAPISSETEAGAREGRGGLTDPNTQLASVSEAEFDAAARETLREASTRLLQHPEARVRTAVFQMSDATTRPAAMQTLWDYAANEADAETRALIYQVCGAVGEANDDPLGQRALEYTASLQPDNVDAWRMLSRSYQRTQQAEPARAVALVADAVQAKEQGQVEAAEQAFQQALQSLPQNNVRAAVAAELGDIAERRGDWGSASARYAEAFRVRQEVARAAPNAVAQAGLEGDADRLVRALDRSGRTRQACQVAQDAERDLQVEAGDQALAERCETNFRVQLRALPARRPVQTEAVQPAPARTP